MKLLIVTLLLGALPALAGYEDENAEAAAPGTFFCSDPDDEFHKLRSILKAIEVYCDPNRPMTTVNRYNDMGFCCTKKGLPTSKALKSKDQGTD